MVCKAGENDTGPAPYSIGLKASSSTEANVFLLPNSWVGKTRMAALVLFVFARPDTVPESPASRLHIICKYLTGKYKERGLP